jgi:hypothetical protein
MDTNKEQPQVPQLQLAKVGERKRRKGGALPFFGGGSGAASHSGGGIWGTVSGIASKSALKIGITLLAGAIGVGAYTTGKSMRPDSSQFERKPQLFASKNEKPQYSASDMANLPGGSAGSQSSVGMVSGSLDGLTPEQREAKAREEEERARKAAEEQAKADAAAAQEPGNVPGMAMPDAAAMAKAAAEKEKAAAFNRKFGELTKGGGSSGLAGGAGMGAGIGRSFESLKNKGHSGVLSTLGSNRAAGTKSSKISTGRNPGRSLAQRQLNRAAMMSRQATAGADEKRATAASIPFDTNQGSGQMLSGTGAGTGSGGARTGAADTSPSSGGGGSPVGVGGGYGEAGEDDCNLLAAQYGWGGEFVNAPSGGCVKKQNVKGTGKDDPTNPYFKILKVLAILAAIISAILFVCAAFLDSVGRSVLMVLGGALVAIGALEAILGLMVTGMGRTLEGGIFAVMGSLTAIAGYITYSEAEAGAKSARFVGETSDKVVYGLLTACQTYGIFGKNAGSASDRTWNSDTSTWE